MEARLAQYAALQSLDERDRYLNFFWRVFVDRPDAEEDAKKWYNKEQKEVEHARHVHQREVKERSRVSAQITGFVLLGVALLLAAILFAIDPVLLDEEVKKQSVVLSVYGLVLPASK
jgi:hypothetical protein